MNSSEDKVILFYKGPFKESVLSELSNDIKSKLGSNPVCCQKVFSIFMELAQNVSYYSEEKAIGDVSGSGIGIGTFIINEKEEEYIVSSGNLISKEWAKEITEKSKLINSLPKEDLRKLKREMRNLPKREGHSGANIGIIDVALKSGNPISIEITPVDSKTSYYVLSTSVSKIYKDIEI
jgi:hypothetical protein